MIPMPITQTRGKSSGWATRCTWRRVSIPSSPLKPKEMPQRVSLQRSSPPKRPKTRWQDWQALKSEQERLGIEPQAMYVDAGYVTETTLAQAEQNGMELLGPTRPDPHKGPYNADAFHVDIEKRQAVCPQGNLSTQCSRIRDSYMGTEYYRIEWGS